MLIGMKQLQNVLLAMQLRQLLLYREEEKILRKSHQIHMAWCREVGLLRPPLFTGFLHDSMQRKAEWLLVAVPDLLVSSHQGPQRATLVLGRSWTLRGVIQHLHRKASASLVTSVAAFSAFAAEPEKLARHRQHCGQQSRL
jgi:hypothetical protein